MALLIDEHKCRSSADCLQWNNDSRLIDEAEHVDVRPLKPGGPFALPAHESVAQNVLASSHGQRLLPLSLADRFSEEI